MDFVVGVLRKVFGYTVPKCFELMLEAHEKGRAVVWVGALEVAELKADQIRSCGPDPAAKPRGAQPLGVSVEPAALMRVLELLRVQLDAVATRDDATQAAGVDMPQPSPLGHEGEFLNVLVENLPISLLVFAPADRRLLAINRHAEKEFRLRRGAVIGKLPDSTSGTSTVASEDFESGALSAAWSKYSSDATLGRVLVHFFSSLAGAGEGAGDAAAAGDVAAAGEEAGAGAEVSFASLSSCD